jgi:hypothetical protein
MKIIIFYIFLILIFIPILFKIVFITRTIESFKNGNDEDKKVKKEKKKKNKKVIYKMIGDNKSYTFLYGKNTVEILPSNKTKNITDMYFNYKSFPDKTIANINSFDDISSSEFMIKTPKNKYKISFSSSEIPITIIINETEYMIELKKKKKDKKDKGEKFDIIWYQKVVGTIDGFDITLNEKRLNDVEIIMVLYTAILIIKKMKDLDNVNYNKIFD